jgi:hypothetical protein
MLKSTYFLLVLIPLLVTTPTGAFGYADPGTGAFVYQAAYGVVLGATFYFRRFLNRIWRKKK